MIDALREWAMVLSGVAIFSSLCEVILPEGSIQKYIRLGLGMILVLALLSPVQKLLRQDWKADDLLESQSAYVLTENMEERQREEVLKIYRTNLEQKMLSAIRRKNTEFSGEIRCSVEETRDGFGTIREVVILPDEREVDEEEVQKILTEEFGITAEQISLRF